MSKEKFEFMNYRSSIYSKIILFALNMNGITICKNNIFKRVAGTIFHVLVILSATRSFACIFYGADLQDYYVGILLSVIFTIILWWSLFFQSKRFCKLIEHLSSRKFEGKFSSMKTILVLPIIIFMFPPTLICIDVAIMISNNDGVPQPNYTSCRSYWLDRNNVYVRIFLITHDMVLSYVNYTVFFAAFLIFATCGTLLLKRLRETETRLPFVNISTTWRELNYYTFAFKEMEKTMSFSLFLLISKIAVDIFNAVSRFVTFDERSSTAKYSFMVSIPQVTTWFVIIVILGDSLHSKSLIILDAIYESLNREGSVVRFGYYDYKKIKNTMILTVWKMFRINRNLLVSATTFVVTYGVIITQFKQHSDSTVVEMCSHKTAA